MVKIVIPVNDEEASSLSEHFGHAPFFAWFKIEGKQVLDRGVAKNDSEHFGGTGKPPERIAALNADVVITFGMGLKAIEMFQERNIAVFEAISPSTVQNIVAYSSGLLKELTHGCLHSN